MTFWEWFFLFLIFIPLVMMWGAAVVDIFGRPDITGLQKALWVVGLFVFPWLGFLVYVLTRPHDVPGVFGPKPIEAEAYRQEPTVAKQLESLATLRNQGAITEAEFAEAKSRVLAGTQPGTKAA